MKQILHSYSICKKYWLQVYLPEGVQVCDSLELPVHWMQLRLRERNPPKHGVQFPQELQQADTKHIIL